MKLIKKTQTQTTEGKEGEGEIEEGKGVHIYGEGRRLGFKHRMSYTDDIL